MLTRIIDWSLRNRVLVVLGTLAAVIAGGYAVRATPWRPSPT